MPAGRPTLYKPEYCEMIIEHFNIEPYRDIEIPHYDESGNVKWTDTKRVANQLPSLIGFARKIGVGIRTVYDWIDEKHPSYQKEFSHLYNTLAKELRKDTLIQNGLQGLYNAQFTMFTAKNMTDMRDRQEIEHTGTGLTINIGQSKEKK